MQLNEIDSLDRLSDVIQNSSWQLFEEIVGKVFGLHGYEVEVGKVVTFEGTRRQYDVIAEKEHLVFVDCKKWDNKRRIKYALKKSVEDQVERVEKLDLEEEGYPMIVVSSSVPLEKYKEVPIVSIYKLNRFIADFSWNSEEILSL